MPEEKSPNEMIIFDKPTFFYVGKIVERMLYYDYVVLKFVDRDISRAEDVITRLFCVGLVENKKREKIMMQKEGYSRPMVVNVVKLEKINILAGMREEMTKKYNG